MSVDQYEIWTTLYVSKMYYVYGKVVHTSNI